jgi:hypothetical protein
MRIPLTLLIVILLFANKVTAHVNTADSLALCNLYDSTGLCAHGKIVFCQLH